MPPRQWARCWHTCQWGQGCAQPLVQLPPCSYLVPKIGAGCNPVELLVGVQEVLEVSAEELLRQAQRRRHFLAVAAQQEPPGHVDELWGKSNRRSPSEAPESIWVLMLQKSESQGSRKDDNRLTTAHASHREAASHPCLPPGAAPPCCDFPPCETPETGKRG